LGVTQVALADHIGVSVQRVNELVRGKRGITPETAWLLAQALDTSPEFWLNLQALHDLARSRPSKSVALIGKAGRLAARLTAARTCRFGPSRRLQTAQAPRQSAPQVTPGVSRPRPMATPLLSILL